VDVVFLTGLAGSLLLVAGAAWPDHRVSHPTKSVKNWLLALGGFLMFLYAVGNYRAGGSVFFVILEVMVLIASFFMMAGTRDVVDTPVLAAAGLGLVLWSVYLFEDYGTVVFILGLCGVSIGYALDTGSRKRQVVLLAGSALIALFSYLEGNAIFFWLNLFFAVFSGYYLWKMRRGMAPRKVP